MSKLFSPIKIGRYELEHRVVLAPLTRFRATLEAVPTELSVNYYAQRASPGGLLITEAIFISRMAGSYPHAPGIYTQDQIDQWKKVTSAVHEKGAIIYAQLWDIGRAGFSSLNPNNETPVAPSAIAIEGKFIDGTPFEVPRSLETEEIKELVNTFRQAAINAMEAGFDGIEIHNANGYLLDQFVNSSANKRTDEYGGSIQNRCRFSLEVLEAIAGAIGADRTAIRFSPEGRVQSMMDDTPLETWGYLISEIQRKHPDLSYLHCIEARSNFHSDGQNTVDSLAPYRQMWKGPFISAGGYSTVLEHAVTMAENTGNLIAFGRAFIANPDLPERLRNKYKLNPYNRETFYTNDAAGYTDYPVYDEKNSHL